MGNKINHLLVREIINSDVAVSADDGDLVFAEINKALTLDQAVELDFSGIQILITAFLNAAIGQLYSKYEGEQLNAMLKLTNVANEDKILFKKVVERAKEYFANKREFEDSANAAFHCE
ncbi:MAG: STAS-like domain-containing protein [Chlorobi bacterium]|nr:STAS-like domain-containing protein [Chlorobiota bacterium]